MPASDHLDRVGIIGATIAALCCLGLPAILSVLTAIGLGFIVNDAVLAPLLIVSLALIVWALVRGFRRHGNATALVIGSAASLILVMATLIWPLRSAAYASIVALVLASIANVVLWTPTVGMSRSGPCCMRYYPPMGDTDRTENP